MPAARPGRAVLLSLYMARSPWSLMRRPGRRLALGGAGDAPGGAVECAGGEQGRGGVGHEPAGDAAAAAERDGRVELGARRRRAPARSGRRGRRDRRPRARARPSSAAWTSTSKPTRTPASLPVTRARVPGASRELSRSSRSKSTGDQRRISSGCVSTSRSCSGVALVVVVAVQSAMATRLPPARFRVVGLKAIFASPLGRSRVRDRRHPRRMTRVVAADDAGARARGYLGSVMSPLESLRTRIRSDRPVHGRHVFAALFVAAAVVETALSATRTVTAVR